MLDVVRSRRSMATGLIYLSEPVSGRKLMVSKQSKLQDYYNRLMNKLNQRGITKHVIKYSGERIYRTLIDENPHSKEMIPGIFFEWDNTPRHGYRGYIITPPKQETFLEYMDLIKDSDYVIVNAWNEWAEGMMLEPSTELGFRYLEWIKNWAEQKVDPQEK